MFLLERMEHVPKEIRKVFSKLVPKMLIIVSLLYIFMLHFQSVGSMSPTCAGSMFPTEVPEIFLQIFLHLFNVQETFQCMSATKLKLWSGLYCML